MKKFYVLGNPIKHSLSPTIFNYWFKKYGLNCKYEKKLVKKNNFNKIFNKTISNKNCYGLNITLPFKQDTMELVDKVDNHARKIGAVNCVYKKKNKRRQSPAHQRDVMCCKHGRQT